MITLYGHSPSRIARCIWMLEETGVSYRIDDLSAYDQARKSTEFTAINPNQKVPALKDGEFVMWESLAINMYLAESYAPNLWPQSPAGRAGAMQWSLWAIGELDPRLFTALLHRMLLPEERREEAQAVEADAALQKPLGVLNGELEKSPFLLGKAFSVADLNVASVVSWARFGRVDLSPFPVLKAWLKGCLERPASQKALAVLKG